MWNYEKIEQMINDQIPEGLTIEYKRRDSLLRTEEKRVEITKDVSAMANAAGGVILYGVAGYNEKAKKHLPEQIDPIEIGSFTPEWLQQMIDNIRPRVDGLVITPILVTPDGKFVIYAVEIPQSATAHQALDKRYHKRLNATTIAMEDYEIRDVMARSKHPRLDLKFTIVRSRVKPERSSLLTPMFNERAEDKVVRVRYQLVITCNNIGSILANYVTLNLKIPSVAVHASEMPDRSKEFYLKATVLNNLFQNTTRDVVDVKDFNNYVYGPRRFVPILPSLSHEWTIRLRNTIYDQKEPWFVEWSLHCDNAPPQTGKIASNQMEEMEYHQIQEDDISHYLYNIHDKSDDYDDEA